MAYPLLGHRLGPVVIAASLTAGCFTDPVNMAPIVTIEAPLGPIYLGTAQTYTATASDPDGDSISPIEWTVTASGCGTEFQDPAHWPSSPPWQAVGSSGEIDLTPADTLAPYCVWAKATDQYGAASVDALEGDPLDHAPVAAVKVVSPGEMPAFPLHTLIELSARGSTDVDPGDMAQLTFAWTLELTPSPTGALVPCADALQDEGVRCLKADVAGEYQVQVVVTDPHGESSTAELSLLVLAGQVPTASIDLVSPLATGNNLFPLNSVFQLSGQNYTPTNIAQPSFAWTLLKPGSTTPVPIGDSVTTSFTADMNGIYQVALVVSDADGSSVPVTAQYAVATHQPPCIATTTPQFGQGGMTTVTETTMTAFTVEVVQDDSDPYPSPAPNMLLMEWLVSINNAPFTVALAGFPSFMLDASQFSPTDMVLVRLQVQDRYTDAAAQEFLGCGDAPSCMETSLIYPQTCYQRVTWLVNPTAFLPSQ